MLLVLKDLYRLGECGAEKRRGLKTKDSAIMLLKTNVEKMSLLGPAIISMKIKGLFHSCHYIYENKVG